jgi:hypothetical protein
MTQGLTKNRRAFRRDLATVKKLWPGQIHGIQRESLEALRHSYQFSAPAGDLQLLGGRWYVTHSGLMRLSHRNGCSSIQVHPVPRFCDAEAHRWVFKATVYKLPGSRGFVGHRDADPSNTSALVRGAEMRVAETRAVNRALRKAYGIGLCSVEELGWPSSAPSPTDNHARPSKSCASNGSSNGHPRLRDQLCLLIRKYELDPTLVKRYAADFCGTEALRDASRDLVEAFMSTLAEEAVKDRAALICKLNSYNQLAEVKS